MQAGGLRILERSVLAATAPDLLMGPQVASADAESDAGSVAVVQMAMLLDRNVWIGEEKKKNPFQRVFFACLKHRM